MGVVLIDVRNGDFFSLTDISGGNESQRVIDVDAITSDAFGIGTAGVISTTCNSIVSSTLETNLRSERMHSCVVFT